MRKTAVTRTAARTTEGLRDLLFDEIDKLRNGKCNPGHANALAKLASTILETSRIEIDVARLIARAGEAKQIQPLALGKGHD